MSKMIENAENSAKSWYEISENLIETCKNIDSTKFSYTDEFSTIDFLGHADYLNEQIGEFFSVDLAQDLDLGDSFVSRSSEESSELESTLQHRISGQTESGFKEHYRPKTDLSEKYESSVGRFISTNEPISEGALIMEENAFAFVPVSSGKEMNHCQHCGEINCVPISCPKCKFSSYCSKECRDDHKYIHQLECAGYQMKLWMNVGIAHLAFRTFITGFDQSQRQFAKMTQNSTPFQVLLNLVNHDTNFVYRDVLKLVTNFDKMNATDLFMYCLTARMLVLYLEKYTNFFREMPVICLKIMPEIDDWKRYAMALILKHLGHMIMNAHTISGIELIPLGHINPRNFHLITEVNFIFSAIFPKTSILNHSCNENTRNFFDGRTLRMFAQYDIPKNAEVSNSYGPNYKTDPMNVRQNILMERYHFQCVCEKCTTSDKTFDLLSQQTCSNESCKSQINLNNIEFQWWNCGALDDSGIISEIMPLFRCKRCHEMQKLNPENIKKYFDQVRTAKNEKIELTVRFNCLEESAYYYLDSVTSLAIGHELRLAMGEEILAFDIYDLAAERDITVPLALVAVDFCKNTMQRSGFYSLEYMKSMTYAFHLLNLIPPHKDVFKKMIEKSLEIKNIYKYIHILPDKMHAIYKQMINKVCIFED